MFLICKSMYILKVYSIHDTLRWNTNVKKISFGQNNWCKKCPFFFGELQLIALLLLICDSYMRWSTRFFSLKLRVGHSIFDSILFLIKFMFLFNKMNELFDSRTSYSWTPIFRTCDYSNSPIFQTFSLVPWVCLKKRS